MTASTMPGPRARLLFLDAVRAWALILVGSCLPLSASRAGRDERAALGRWAVRGLGIILAGLLLNVLVFPEDPIWSNGVLQTLGVSQSLDASRSYVGLLLVLTLVAMGGVGRAQAMVPRPRAGARRPRARVIDDCQTRYVGDGGEGHGSSASCGPRRTRSETG